MHTLAQKYSKPHSYSVKAAWAGHDIGRRGRNFAKIAKAGDAKYGKGHGARIAGAILARLRAKYK